MADAAPNPKPSAPQRLSIRLWRPMCIVLVAVALVAAVSYYVAGIEHPLPRPEEIQRMEAGDVSLANHPGPIDFDVPQSYWDAILSSLVPARKDHDPAKWQQVGHLSIELSNGGAFEISIFTIDGTRGAFAAGPTWEQRVYYRGGSTAAVEKALAEAFEASQRTKLEMKQ